MGTILALRFTLYNVLVGVGSVGKKLKEGSMTRTQGQRLTCLIPFAMVLHLFHLFTNMVGKHENKKYRFSDTQGQRLSCLIHFAIALCHDSFAWTISIGHPLCLIGDYCDIIVVIIISIGGQVQVLRKFVAFPLMLEHVSSPKCAAPISIAPTDCDDCASSNLN